MAVRGTVGRIVRGGWQRPAEWVRKAFDAADLEVDDGAMGRVLEVNE